MNPRHQLTLALLVCSSPLFAQTAVFWQPGFPTIGSKPISQAALTKALEGLDPSFVDLAALESNALAKSSLLILPYGSAVPVDAWKEINTYIGRGGNLLILGGQPLRVPVNQVDGKFTEGGPQDTYSRSVGLLHTYEVPVSREAQFKWKSGYSFGAVPQIKAEKFFTMEGRLNGLGYMVDPSGTLVAAPIIVLDRPNHGRVIALDFQPAPGYWDSNDGQALIRQAATYASHGATQLSVETLFSVIRPNEPPHITVRLYQPTSGSGEVTVDLLSDDKVIDTATIATTNDQTSNTPVPFQKLLPPGFYKIRATYTQQKQFREFYENGFWVADPNAINEGPTLGVKGDFLTRDGHPFFPVGTNYFTTEENGWDFSGSRNASIWEKDFADMAAHGVTFVRTGVWMKNARFIEPGTNEPSERFMRNLEAFLLCARHHGIAVNFTFFAFSPISGPVPQSSDTTTIVKNPYIDPDAIHMEKAYIQAVATRFAHVPWLCYDLINEPSFSNPRQIFKGNIPNGDPAEVEAWHAWLKAKYTDLDSLAQAWSQTPNQLVSFDSIPLPAVADLTYERSGNPRQIHTLDYNLFAQEMFTRWVQSMIATIRHAGSTQLVNVGQDEGGVTNRLLNQFYGSSGVAFTTNHTYWQDDALLWDSVAAKLPGMPNITGETGYQPAWTADGTWRYDEFTGFPLTERKWALGFANGSSGVMQWDWAREIDFGMQRSDGSAKVYEEMMRGVATFAEKAAPYATAFIQPEIAIVLPQSLQLSSSNSLAVEAQQNAVRALFYYARGEAYVVGEYQIESIGSPKLIILPSPFGFTETAWQAILAKVKAGATLLITGPFDLDAHMHPTGRQDAIGLTYKDAPLSLRDNAFTFPGGKEDFIFAGSKTTVLTRAQLQDSADWKEISLGKGKLLFTSLPIELSDNPRAIGDVYRYAMKAASISPTYTTTLADNAMLICPTRFPNATLYVLTSESNRTDISFHDERSGKYFSGHLEPGRAALLLISRDGKLLATYNWPNQ